MRLKTPAPVVTEDERAELQALLRRRSCPRNLYRRGQIILLAADGYSQKEIQQRVDGCTRNMIRLWWRRWAEQAEAPATERLLDAPRPGKPSAITAEQICEIIALSLRAPRECGWEMDAWTQNALAQEVIRREIVAQISPRHVGRFLKGGRPEAATIPLLAQSQG